MLCSNKIDNKIKTIVYLQQHYYGSDQTLIKSDISNHCPRRTAEIRSRLRSLVSLSPHVPLVPREIVSRSHNNTSPLSSRICNANVNIFCPIVNWMFIRLSTMLKDIAEMIIISGEHLSRFSLVAALLLRHTTDSKEIYWMGTVVI